ncbi:Rne/Rng family ribonuclease [Citreimonas salinaria]|uniref:Ribonuclease E n=1 Tax=Citreimonas salinaria TaxID=321339 RepID=A0A1H3GAV7_9RHOB|nr:Rne/Rng family ribonuclease [Citreimonas salinaria]SDX99644.1 RNAse E [Citreimonas salinaria]
MAKKMLIDATHAEETRVVVVDGNKVEEFDFESENKRQLAGNIYLAKVTRVEPSLQAAFVDYGGNRHGFLAFSEIHPDYYQIPIADRRALMEEEAALAAAEEEEETKPRRTRARRGAKAESTRSDDKTTTADAPEDAPAAEPREARGMETIDLGEDQSGDPDEGLSPMERVTETPVEEPEDNSGEHGKAAARDEAIESVADDDTQDDFRPARKPRARRYKIQEVVKVRQIMLVQVVKEERGNKGAALTTYLSLAGRYCVLMPNTARGGGISRKITNAADRQKLKAIANEIDVPKGAGLIIRTAGAQRTKTEIRRDYEYLQRLWEQIRELTLRSIAPTKIYEEGDLIKRSIRDLYNRDIDEVLVEGEAGYRIAKDFMKMIMPSHAKNVKHYADPMPLFARHQVESYLGGMFNPTVQLKSGGYIVIGVTEALVAIDVNSGRATKEGSIEETALKTNLEAAEEVARQLRLRDLAGLIVIDFIDMDERKNNAAVEKKLKDKLKTDRARIQVGRISGFGLLEMSRQRLRPGMIEATTQPCTACHGTGLIRSDDSMALQVLRQIEEEGTRRRSREVLVKCPVGISNYLMNLKREHVAMIEARYGMSVRIEGDPKLVAPDFTIEKFKTATRPVSEAAPFVSADAALMDQIDEDAALAEPDPDEAPAPAGETSEVEQAAEPSDKRSEKASDDDGKPKKKRRRRRRRSKNGNGENGQSENGETGNGDDGDGRGGQVREDEPAVSADKADTPVPFEPAQPETLAGDEDGAPSVPDVVTAEEASPDAAEKPKRKRTRTRKKPEPKAPEEAASEAAETEATGAGASQVDAKPEADVQEAPEAAERPAATEAVPEAGKPAEEPVPEAETARAEPESRPRRTRRKAAEVIAEVVGTVTGDNGTEDDSSATDEDSGEKPRRRGWWSIGR